MKHVPECERDPIEAIKTNVFGSENVLRAAEMRNVECVVVLSTDKAVEPSSVMGHTKALMEKLALGVERPIRVCGVRFGNVIGTDGSVIPLFERLISEGKPLTITDSRMRRYMMTPREAVDLVFTAYSEGKPGDLFVQQSGVWTIKAVAEAVALLKGVWDYPIIEIGSRPGEKLDESLISLAELPRARWLGEFVVVSRQNLATVLDPVGMSTNLCIVSSGAMLVPLIEESKEALK
jgi:UDP-glucose 4-epimerase